MNSVWARCTETSGMKNLVLEGCRAADLLRDSKAAAVADFCIHAAESKIFVSTVDGYVHCCHLEGMKVLRFLHVPWAKKRLRPVSQEEWKTEIYPVEGLEQQVTSMSYVVELDAVCLSMSSGAIVVIHSEAHLAEEVGCIEGGIVAMEWSPDGDVVAIITGTGSMIVMSQVCIMI